MKIPSTTLLGIGFLHAALYINLSTALAGSATWNLNPATKIWNNPANWTPATVPSSATDVATFDVSNLTDITYSTSTEVGAFVFNPGASSYTFTVPLGNTSLTIAGAGITNNSGNPQQFVVSGGRKNMIGGDVIFQGSATAGDAIFTLNPGRFGEFAFPSFASFFDSSIAGAATFIVVGSLTNQNAALQFFDDSDGGTARIELVKGGILSISGHSLTTLTIGSLEGNGMVNQGPGETAIGSNNLSTTFSGVISSVNERGPIAKIGTGRLTLAGANLYTGGTIVNQGTLLVDNTSGSGTGTGDVTVNAGTLGGNGIIAGAVTVGTGGEPASISPGARGNNTGLLTIQGAITFGSLGTYEFQLDSTSFTADTLSTDGVAIGSGARFDARDLGSSAFPSGTTLLIIDNTGVNPIAGTFSNLADGAIIPIGSANSNNQYKVNYEGGDGNDLTLTAL
jgi:autotransporter-associated beta strand protein